MSLTDLIDDLSEKSASLRAAMQGGQVALIEGAIEEFGAALGAIQAVGQWPAKPELREKLITLLPQLEEARAMACLLSDLTGQAHQQAAARARDARQPLYGRSGDRMA